MTNPSSHPYSLQNYYDIEHGPGEEEENVETVGDLCLDTPDEEEFLVMAVGSAEEKDLYDKVPYCSQWKKRSGLYLSKSDLIKRAYSHRREMGLFSLFLNGSYLQCIHDWTSKGLLRRRKKTKPLRMDGLLVYFGLELATPIHRVNLLREYGSMSDVLGIPFFQKTMGRDKFLNIIAALRLYPSYDSVYATGDPLWHRRSILEQFARNAASLAIPVGVSILDENIVRCKGRTSARSYMKSEPVKFGIRFYEVVGWSHLYLHSVQDNGSGNKSLFTPVQRYTNLFRGLRGAVERKVDGKLLPKSKHSVLWCAQMANQTQLHPTPENGRFMVLYNFYTRDVLAMDLYRLSDGGNAK